MERQPKRPEQPLTDEEVLGAVSEFVRDRRSANARAGEEEVDEVQAQDDLDKGN
jgi:hypothetical protein